MLRNSTRLLKLGVQSSKLLKSSLFGLTVPMMGFAAEGEIKTKTIGVPKEIFPGENRVCMGLEAA